MWQFGNEQVYIDVCYYQICTYLPFFNKAAKLDYAHTHTHMPQQSQKNDYNQKNKNKKRTKEKKTNQTTPKLKLYDDRELDCHSFFFLSSYLKRDLAFKHF